VFNLGTVLLGKATAKIAYPKRFLVVGRYFCHFSSIPVLQSAKNHATAYAFGGTDSHALA